MTTKRSGFILSVVFSLAMTEHAWGQDCPISDLPETAAANIPNQGACELLMQDDFNDVTLMSFECDGAPPAVASGVYAADPDTGACTWHIKIQTGAIQTGGEGEEIDVGRGFGLQRDVIPGTPLATCEAAIADGLILANSVEILSLEATNMHATGEEQPHTRFNCSGTQVVDVGFLLEQDFDIAGGGIYTIETSEPFYIDSDVTYYADMVQEDSGAWVDWEARMHTPSRRDAHPAIVRVEP